MGEKVFAKRAFQRQKNIVRYKTNFTAPRPIELDEVSVMFWYVVIGFFAAFGALCALWVLFGTLLPASTGSYVAVYCANRNEIPVMRRFCWLRELGMTRCELTLIDSGLNKTQRGYIRQRYPFIHFMTRQEWLSVSREECVSVATGNGDPAGHNCRCGISEL